MVLATLPPARTGTTDSYLLVIIFDINATAPPFTSFVFLCNFFSLFFRENVAFRIIAQRYTNKNFLQFVSTLISIWNLDLFFAMFLCQQPHTKHSLCVLLTFYPIYICIELHARNCRVIILLWRPFHKLLCSIEKVYHFQIICNSKSLTALTLLFTN